MVIHRTKVHSARILGRTVKYLAISCIAFGALMLCLAGCTVKDPVTAIFDNAISTLEQQSADWRGVVTKTKDDLIKAGQSTLANEVTQLTLVVIPNIFFVPTLPSGLRKPLNVYPSNGSGAGFGLSDNCIESRSGG